MERVTNELASVGTLLVFASLLLVIFGSRSIVGIALVLLAAGGALHWAASRIERERQHPKPQDRTPQA